MGLPKYYICSGWVLKRGPNYLGVPPEPWGCPWRGATLSLEDSGNPDH